ncbi:MAG: hypothetical protein ACREQY_12570 [Candidatus Binatia bacterium]
MPLLEISNQHMAECGTPPAVRNEPGKYVGYFENRFGEPWVFVGDLSTRSALLRGGDIGWEAVLAVDVESGAAAGLILNPPELLWLRACCEAMRARDEGSS